MLFRFAPGTTRRGGFVPFVDHFSFVPFWPSFVYFVESKSPAETAGDFL
jgi:hypothetical protein